MFPLHSHKRLPVLWLRFRMLSWRQKLRQRPKLRLFRLLPARITPGLLDIGQSASVGAGYGLEDVIMSVRILTQFGWEDVG
jgi:hypothetical protein